MENSLTKAYAEVDKVLSYMESKYVEKIPKKLRELFKNEKEKNYEPNINPKVPLNQQNLQRKTLAILAMLNLSYWCENEEEKQKLLKIYSENDKKKEEEMRKKYNPDNLFKEKNKENTQIVEYKKQSFILKILNKINLI